MNNLLRPRKTPAEIRGFMNKRESFSRPQSPNFGAPIAKIIEYETSMTGFNTDKKSKTTEKYRNKKKTPRYLPKLGANMEKQTRMLD